jgi:hypothetical protein
MIALATAILAVGQVQVDGARPTADADRVYGRNIVFECDVPIEGQAVAFVANLDGELAGTDKGPMRLSRASATSIEEFKSLPGSISFDEKLPIGRRVLYVTLMNKLTIRGSKYLGEVHFTYAQDEVFPNQVYRSDRVTAAKMSLFNARDMKSGWGLYVPKNRAVQPVVEAACRQWSQTARLNGSPQ